MVLSKKSWEEPVGDSSLKLDKRRPVSIFEPLNLLAVLTLRFRWWIIVSILFGNLFNMLALPLNVSLTLFLICNTIFWVLACLGIHTILKRANQEGRRNIVGKKLAEARHDVGFITFSNLLCVGGLIAHNWRVPNVFLGMGIIVFLSLPMIVPSMIYRIHNFPD